jgi:GMP synthase-like glutamine amidotransferase
VRPLDAPRFGVAPLRLTRAGREDRVLGDLDGAATFENRSWGVYAPEGLGVVLAEGRDGDVVAARFGAHVLGVMFHPEADEAGARATFVEGGIGGEPAGSLDRVFAAVVPGFVRLVRG